MPDTTEALSLTVPVDRNATADEDSETLIRLYEFDPNAPIFKSYVKHLPTRGQLYQFDDATETRGASITNAPTLLNDNLGRVVYVPRANGYGSEFDSFTYYATMDGTNTDTATVTINVNGRPDPPLAEDRDYEAMEGVVLRGNLLADVQDADRIAPRFFAIRLTRDIVEIDLTTYEVKNTFMAPVAQLPYGGLDFDGYNLFLTSGLFPRSVYEINPDTGSVVAIHDIYLGATARVSGTAVIGNNIYVFDLNSEFIYVFNRVQRAITRTIPFGQLNSGVRSFKDIAALQDPPRLIIFDGVSSNVHFIDPGTGLIESSFSALPRTPSIATLRDEVFLANSPSLTNEIAVYSVTGDLLRTFIPPVERIASIAAYEDPGMNGPYSVQLTTNGLRGILSLESGGSFSYQPPPNYTGPDRFTYVIDDGEAVSDPVEVTIQVQAINRPPEVTLVEPSPEARLLIGQSLDIIAEVIDIDGTVASVEFFFDSIKVGERLQEPYEVTVADLAIGNHTIGIQARDDKGAVRAIDPITIRVEDPLHLTVTTTADAGPGSLREALGQVSAGGLISIIATGRLALTTGVLEVNRDMTMTGPGANALVISGGSQSGILHIRNGQLALSQVTLSDGQSVLGGAILNEGSLTASHCVIRDSQAEVGGGLLNASNALARLVNCSFINNAARPGNSPVGQGGGIANLSEMFLDQCTLSGNQADWGGGLLHLSSQALTLESCTVADNVARRGGGGLMVEGDIPAASATHSILAGNMAPDGPDVAGTLFSLGHNLVGISMNGLILADQTETDLVGSRENPLDPRLSPLALHGGNLPTHALLVGSPAIDAGANAPTARLDQRGSPRNQDGDGDGIPAWDVGAFEVRKIVVTATGNTPPPVNLATNGSFEILKVPEHTFPGWMVNGGLNASINVDGAPHGKNLVHLGGSLIEPSGKMWQDIETIPGRDYRIRFVMGNNSDFTKGVTNILRVHWGDQHSADYAYDFTTSEDRSQWLYTNFAARSETSLTRLMFENKSGFLAWTSLDDIRVELVEEISGMTLHEAITEANAWGGGLIGFNIENGGPQLLALRDPLPPLQSSINLDARTQPGYNGLPLIQLHGADTVRANGLFLSQAPSAIRGISITDFDFSGIRLQEAGGHVIQANHIGLNPAGNSLGRNQDGILIVDSSDNLIGGAGPGEGNLISGNRSTGIRLYGEATMRNRIQGNLIGTQVRGFGVAPNPVGISLSNDSSSNLIGGVTWEAGNVISGNVSMGIRLSGGDMRAGHNIIQRNLIGVAADGMTPLGNVWGGTIFGAGIWIGSPTQGAQILENVIAHNGASGIQISGYASNILIRANSIHLNSDLGINLNDDGPTPNDPLDADAGANQSQNFPVLHSVSSEGLVAGTLSSAPLQSYTIQFYANAECDPTDFGEGKTYLGAIEVMTDNTGEADFSFQIVPVFGEPFITALANDLWGNTSEFSPCAPNTPPSIDHPIQLTMLEDSILVFSTETSTSISMNDIDAGTNVLGLELECSAGALTLSNPGSVIFIGGDGMDDARLSMKGSLHDLNAALQGMSYRPPPDISSIQVTLSLRAHDFGFTGRGSEATTDSAMTIVIEPVNDAPTFVMGPDILVSEDAGLFVAPGWAMQIRSGPENELFQKVEFLITTGNEELFSARPTLSMDGTLTFHTTPEAFGLAEVTAILKDDGGRANGGEDQTLPRTFRIEVSPVNDSPAFLGGPDVTVTEDAGAQAIPAWARDIRPGPPNETNQALRFETSNNNSSLFSQPPLVTLSGTLQFTTTPDAYGMATVTVRLYDDGGRAFGGSDQSTEYQFQIHIDPVNDPPRAKNQSLTTMEDQALSLTLSASDVEGDALVFIVTDPAHGSLTGTPPFLTYTPHTNFHGTDSFTFTASDGHSTSERGQTTITVQPVNDPPIPLGQIVDAWEFSAPPPIWHVVSTDNVAARVVMDGSASTDADGDSLTILWLQFDTGAMLGAGPIVTNDFTVGHHQILLVVDDGIDLSSALIELEVLTLGQTVEELIDILESSPVDRNLKRPLLASLKSAIASFDRELFKTARNQLRAFLNKVNAQENRLPEDTAQALTKLGESIRHLPSAP